MGNRHEEQVGFFHTYAPHPPDTNMQVHEEVTWGSYETSKLQLRSLCRSRGNMKRLPLRPGAALASQLPFSLGAGHSIQEKQQVDA